MRSRLITDSGTAWNWNRRRASPKNLGAAQHLVVPIDLRVFGGSALTSDIAVPKGRPPLRWPPRSPSPTCPRATPCFSRWRWRGPKCSAASDIFIGVNAFDYSGYPDCRPEYIEAYEHMANLATKAGVEGRMRLKIHTPLIRLSKAEIVKLGASWVWISA